MKGEVFGIGLRQRRNDDAPERIEAWLCSAGPMLNSPVSASRPMSTTRLPRKPDDLIPPNESLAIRD
jgi:hypothetical protein